jgi:hypothetical protein
MAALGVSCGSARSLSSRHACVAQRVASHAQPRLSSRALGAGSRARRASSQRCRATTRAELKALLFDCDGVVRSVF